MDNNRYGIMRQGSGIWRSLRDSDFEEEDIWDVLRDNKDSSDSKNFGKSSDSSISFSISRNLSAARMIPPRANSSGSSSSNHSSHETNFGVSVHQQSAPVNIPDWSKISKKKSSKNVDSWQDPDDYDDGGGDYEYNNQDNYVDGDYDDGDNSYRLPPHEVISRRLARSQISSFSVFEGVGRKLKGRDLSKVRNAVLTRTGFLESP